MALKDYRREPRLSRLRRDETGEVIYRDEPEWRADIVRLRGPMPSDRGLPDRSGVTRSQPDGPRLWTMRCPPCRFNVELSDASLGAVLDALYPVVAPDPDGERSVELASVQAIASHLHLLR